jgi:ribosomal protein S18 acetylase RimI-like enzyme
VPKIGILAVPPTKPVARLLTIAILRKTVRPTTSVKIDAMNPATISVNEVSPIDFGNTLQWLFPHIAVDRAQWILEQLTERVQNKRMSEIIAIEAKNSEGTLCAAVTVLQPARAASLLAIHSLGRSEAAEQAVFSHLRTILSDRGTQFLQAPSDTEQNGLRLTRLGFKHLAKLAVLVLESETMARINCDIESRLQFLPTLNDASMIDRIGKVAEASFSESDDCPALSEFRTPTEIIDGFRKSSQFDPLLWRLATLGGTPVGCLLLTPHGEVDSSREGGPATAFGAVEISYMGLVPAYRKRGLGTELLVESIRIAKQNQASRMVLAVDRENSPAIALYQRQGWIEAAEESVWGMHISPQFAAKN